MSGKLDIRQIRDAIDGDVAPALDRLADDIEGRGRHRNVVLRGALFWALTRLRAAGVDEALIRRMIDEDFQTWAQHSRRGQN